MCKLIMYPSTQPMACTARHCSKINSFLNKNSSTYLGHQCRDGGEARTLRQQMPANARESRTLIEHFMGKTAFGCNAADEFDDEGFLQIIIMCIERLTTATAPREHLKDLIGCLVPTPMSPFRGVAFVLIHTNATERLVGKTAARLA